jgi:hypothetical protein
MYKNITPQIGPAQGMGLNHKGHEGHKEKHHKAFYNCIAVF